MNMIELVISVAITMAVTGGIFAVLNPAHGTFQTQPELADMQQRLRVGNETLVRVLSMAGAGSYSGSQSGSLVQFFAPILPYRQGGNSAMDDGGVRFRSDAITVMYVPATASQATIRDALADESAPVRLNADAGCPADATHLCGFTESMDVIVYDAAGRFDTFTVQHAEGDELVLRHNQQSPLAATYAAGAKIAQVVTHVYYLNRTTNQLMHYNGHRAAGVPVLDNVVGLAFEYLGESRPPELRVPEDTNRMTTYGPKPPPLGTQVGTYWPPGENCTFAAIGPPAERHVSRLPVILGTDDEPIRLNDAGHPESSLTDGPWCPDPAAANRWDADLLRIRRVTVTLRVQSAVAALRGRNPLLFRNPGTSLGGGQFAPDRELRFDVTPRNMNAGG
jgi:Tfp pilus assembly protein PilW